MIDFVKGRLVEPAPTRVVVEAGGVGYALAISLNTYDGLPAAGSEILLYVHEHGREDVVDLYGFATRAERRLFEALLGVSGIGPKTAMNALGGLSLAVLVRAIAEENVKLLGTVSGIGRKTAERIVVELKAKMTPAAFPEAFGSTGGPADVAANDAMAALVSLGYKQAAALRAVEAARRTLGDDAKPEEIIRAALRAAADGSGG